MKSKAKKIKRKVAEKKWEKVIVCLEARYIKSVEQRQQQPPGRTCIKNENMLGKEEGRIN